MLFSGQLILNLVSKTFDFYISRRLEEEIEHKRQQQQQCQNDLNEVDRTVRDNSVSS